MPYEEILENGIIKMKENSYIKILKIIPINFNLKSNFEKEAILNSYKAFLKSCNFDIQILIQSNKADISKHIKLIKENKEKCLEKISDKYVEYLNNLSLSKKSATKNFYIIIKKYENIENNIDTIIFDELNDKYLKIKEYLSNCGNIVIDISTKFEIEKILFSFFNSRKFYNSEVI